MFVAHVEESFFDMPDCHFDGGTLAGGDSAEDDWELSLLDVFFHFRSLMDSSVIHQDDAVGSKLFVLDIQNRLQLFEVLDYR